MILLAYRHGLRASELVDLRWEQVDLKARPWPCAGSRTARRARTPSPAESCANCAGTKGKARNRPSSSYPSAGRRCRVSAAHAHMLRHACGFKLAKAGVDTRALQAYLGHRNIQHTVRYTELAPDRFKDFWRD